MEFMEFAESVKEKIEDYLPTGFASQVELRTVTKANDVHLVGLTISTSNTRITPTIYLESFFQSYEKGEALDDILAKIARIRVESSASAEEFSPYDFTDFEAVKGLIVPRLLNAAWNSELLADRPHRMMDDLAITYHIMLSTEACGQASVAVTNGLLSSWDGVDVDMLHDLAVANMQRLMPTIFRSMFEVLHEMVPEFADEMDGPGECLYVLSNQEKVNGAAAILDRKMMDQICERLGEEFYVIPSSVHELLICPAKEIGADSLRDMIREVNATAVDQAERLSDHPYRYSRKTGLVSV